MSSLRSSDLDAIHSAEIALAAHIQTAVLDDINIGKLSQYELAGRLGQALIGVEALKTRKTWTLHYAIYIAHRLGYKIGKIDIIKND